MPTSSPITHDSFWTHDYPVGGHYILWGAFGPEATWLRDSNLDFLAKTSIFVRHVKWKSIMMA